MHRPMLSLFVIAAAAAACQPAMTPLTEDQKAAIAAEVDSVASDWWAAWAAADFDRGMSFIDDGPEAAWTGDEGTVYTRAEMDRTWRPSFSQVARQDLTFTDSRTIVLAPDVAYTIRAVTGVATDTAGETRPEIRSVETIAWVRRNGRWTGMAGHESLQKESWPASLAYEASR